MPVRITITDDHPMIIDGLRNMILNYPQFSFHGAYPEGTSLLAGIRNDPPDVLLLDIQLPDITGDELVPQILKMHPDIRILALTNIDSALSVHNMLRLGAMGYVLKTTGQKNLIQAIETVCSGREFLEPAMHEKLRQFQERMKKESSLKPSLTGREKEILRLIVEGYTSQEIADTLFIGFRTVEHYRANILLKLDVKNTATLVRKALTLGLAE